LRLDTLGRQVVTSLRTPSVAAVAGGPSVERIDVDDAVEAVESAEGSRERTP
jgi:hypothetical protein